MWLFIHSLFMQAIKLNSRVITILGISSSVIGLILMADWQSIPYDSCTEFSLYHHPELASHVSNTSFPPCATVLPDCPWMNDSLHNITAVMTSEEEVAMLQHTEPLSPRHPVVNQIAYKFAMNVCESLSSSQYHCLWIPNSVITHRLCHACPPICRSMDHTLNFVQFMVGVVIFRISIPIPDIGIMMVISDVVSQEYQVGYERWSICTFVHFCTISKPSWMKALCICYTKLALSHLTLFQTLNTGLGNGTQFGINWCFQKHLSHIWWVCESELID